MTTLNPLRDATSVIDTVGLRRAFGRFPTGVTALCATGPDEAPIGMAVSAFVGVSLDPPLVGVCIQRSSSTWPRLRSQPRIGLSVLGEAHDDACRRLAAKEGDRFAALSWHTTEEGAVLLHGASTWLDCTVESEAPAGDHVLALLRVDAHRTFPDVRPLVFHASDFHRLSKLTVVS